MELFSVKLFNFENKIEALLRIKGFRIGHQRITSENRFGEALTLFKEYSGIKLC